jgi:hypothetical protein
MKKSTSPFKKQAAKTAKIDKSPSATLVKAETKTPKNDAAKKQGLSANRRTRKERAQDKSIGKDTSLSKSPTKPAIS